MRRHDKILAILLAISIIISTALIIVKISTEQQNKNIEISVPLKEVEKLSNILEMSSREVISHLKTSGLTSIAIEETTLADLRDGGRVLILNGWQVMDHHRFLGGQSQVIQELISTDNLNPISYYVFTKDQQVFNKLQQFMIARGYDIKTYIDDELYIIQEIKGTGGFSSIGLGFSEESFDIIKDEGLLPIIYAKELRSKMPQEIDFLTAQLKDKNISVFIPQENNMPKNTKAWEKLEDFLKDSNIILGFDEFLHTSEIAHTAKKLNYSLLRVYNRPAHRWMEEYLLAVRDRNDKILYLHLFLSGDEDMLSYNAQHIAEIKDSITKPGVFTNFKLDAVEKFNTFEFRKGLSFLSALGVIWAIGRILNLYGTSPRYKSLLCLLIFGFFVLLALWDFVIFTSVAGLITAISFPVAGIYGEMKREAYPYSKAFRDVLIGAIKSFLRATFISLSGALILWGIFGNMDTFLGIEKFRGIKALYIVSYVLIILLYLKESNGKISLQKPIISIGGILILVVFSGILFILINRTGNYSIIPIPEWELMFRIWLEKVLPVRPRTKEFLIGFPALMVAGGLKVIGNTKWAQSLYMVALLAEVSMVNTFSHFHISTFISFVRSVESILLGMTLGALVLGGFYLYGKRRKIDV